MMETKLATLLLFLSALLICFANRPSETAAADKVSDEQYVIDVLRNLLDDQAKEKQLPIKSKVGNSITEENASTLIDETTKKPQEEDTLPQFLGNWADGVAPPPAFPAEGDNRQLPYGLPKINFVSDNAARISPTGTVNNISNKTIQAIEDTKSPIRVDNISTVSSIHAANSENAISVPRMNHGDFPLNGKQKPSQDTIERFFESRLMSEQSCVDTFDRLRGKLNPLPVVTRELVENCKIIRDAIRIQLPDRPQVPKFLEIMKHKFLESEASRISGGCARDVVDFITGIQKKQTWTLKSNVT